VRANWVKRTLIAVGSLAVIAAVSGAGYETVMRRGARGSFPAPGRLVGVSGGRRIQLDCRGRGSPTVVLESGLDTFGSLAWASVHDSIAKTTRVCAYSRAGIMWSDPSTTPFSVSSVARDLHQALIASGESAPWVMVGHSLGGPYIMAFTKLYDAEVRGLVFVDATHPDQFARFRDATGQSLMPTPGVLRLGAALAWSGLIRAIRTPPAPPSWPLAIDRVAPAFLPSSIDELRRETEAIPATLAEAGTVRELGDRPLVVLTAGREHRPEELRAMGLTPADGARLLAASVALHENQATWSRRARHEIVPDASHYIQFDRPDVVIAAVREVAGKIR
jgi:pimeloyl-ACP methyl ester carboxylesterase